MQRIATGSAGQAHDSEMEISRKEAFHRAVSGRLPEGVERIFSWNDSSRGNSVWGGTRTSSESPLSLTRPAADSVR